MCISQHPSNFIRTLAEQFMGINSSWEPNQTPETAGWAARL